ncbi:DUF2442 domain-containing protein [uncultured Sphingomonas sp.]|uniref:DUF2442 domain-containing protein n=1 Tax=uncultured Sphingomonas sp. TaxID=158754 RepID=UPI0035CBCAE3
MAEMTDADFAAAEERGRVSLLTTPHARSARYESASGRVIVELTNGCTFSFPARIAQDLEGATDDELTQIEVDPCGVGLHWEKLDVDFTVAGLMAGRFGSARYMRERFGPHWDAVAAE